jgi:hypothetical protein
MSNTLLHSPAKITAQLMIDNLLGGSPVDANGQPLHAGLLPLWPIYATVEPGDPDNVITVYDTTGQDDCRTMDGKIQQHYGIQVRVRAVDHPTGWQQIDLIRHGLSEDVYQENVTIDGSQYSVWCYSGFGQILPLGRDIANNTDRRIFTLNFLMVVNQLS